MSQQIRPKSPVDIAKVTELRAALLDKLRYSGGRDRRNARAHDWFVATTLTLRDQIIEILNSLG